MLSCSNAGFIELLSFTLAHIHYQTLLHKLNVRLTHKPFMSSVIDTGAQVGLNSQLLIHSLYKSNVKV